MYFVLHSVAPLLNQASPIFTCTAVLRHVGIFHIRLVFGEHVLPPAAHDHLEAAEWKTKSHLI